MRYFILVIAVFAALSLAEPTSCHLIEKNRVLDKPDCRCAVKNAGINDDTKMRVITETCLNEFIVISVGDAWIEGKWAKFAYTYCEKLDDADLYSCKSYKYTEENWENKAQIFSRTPREIKDYIRETTDPGDMRYLFPKKNGKR